MRSDLIVKDEIQTSEMKTSNDLQGFEHLLPFLNISNDYQLHEINLINQKEEEKEEKSKSKHQINSTNSRKTNFDEFNSTSTDSNQEIQQDSIKNDLRRKIKKEFPIQTNLTPLLDVVKLPTTSDSSLNSFANTKFGPLKSNSNWIGHQSSGNQLYPVLIKFLDFNLSNGSGSGLLEINGLTEKWPKLITFFEIEIIGRGQHEFLTKKWGANQESDERHWSRFSTTSNFKLYQTFQNHQEENQILFMRWKERFLDGNPKGKEIEGASFAGFYYACLDLTDQENVNSTLNSKPYTHFNRISTEPLPSNKLNQDWSHAKIKAFYYHPKSEPYQELNLRLENSSTAFLRSSATYQFC
ncbi:vacuolar import and degradation protein-domain-containing protein [Melampsora americana]|nr:vacuolar import and degradation protein-domain-containing protein [Melampsora americana]